MKKLKSIYTLIMLSTIAVNGIAQNLVPNPGFEDYTICPSTSFEIDKVILWSSAGGSPDYFNSCAGAGGASVPNNFYGYQNAIIGAAYVGLYTYNRGLSWPDHREHIQADLLFPLTIGVQYYVSMDISFTLDNNEIGFAADKLGMLFTNSSLYDASNPPFTINNALVFIDTIISDTINWYHFESSFIADSAYQKILIGNFFDDSNTNTLDLDTSLYISYYFIDNICVSTDSLTCNQSVGTNEAFQYQSSFNIFPNPSSDYITINTNNSSTFTVSVFSSLGKFMNSQQLNNQTPLYVGHLAKGIYIVEIDTGKEIQRKKIIIQ